LVAMALDEKTKREFLAGVCTAIVLSAGCMLLLANSRAGRWLENGTLDERERLAQNKHQADQRIVIIDVDNASLETLQEKLGRWPWTRRVWTEVIRYVNQGHPQAIAVDAIFSGAESDAVDGEFARVLKQQGNTVIGFTFVQTHMEQQPGEQDEEKQRMLESHQALGRGPASDIDMARYVPNLPIAQLSANAAGLGALNALPDPDGVVRRVGLQYQYGGHIYDSLATRTVQQVEKQPLGWHERSGLFDRRCDRRRETHPGGQRGKDATALAWRARCLSTAAHVADDLLHLPGSVCGERGAHSGRLLPRPDCADRRQRNRQL
jgi:CHASE2 domain-containing sensor protein